MSDQKSPWQKWKENAGVTRPWDVFNPNNEQATEEEAKVRMDICLSCPELLSITKQCKKCGCFMSLKTKFKLAECPIKKW